MYPWLILNEKGGLLCSTCIRAGKISGDSSGIYARSVWTKTGIFSHGSTSAEQKMALRGKVYGHKKSQVHITATEIEAQADKNVLPNMMGKQDAKFSSTTAKLMRTAYSLAKHNRPYVAYTELCDLQEANGVNLGIGLHSRFSATGMIDCIAESMRKNLCTNIRSKKLKISIILDESTTVSRKSCLVVYLRTAIPSELSDECFAFPLTLIELQSLSANHITETVLRALHKAGFDDAYLRANLLGVCSDGASVMLGCKSGVLTQIKEMFPNVFLWHCMCHRIELAIGKAVASVTQVNHVKSMLDKLYSIYSQSPKAQRELQECAGAVGSELQKVGRVLGVRWVASSYRSLLAVWTSYGALYAHSTASESAKSKKHKSTYAGIASALESREFLHSLVVMLDALKEVSALSKLLQEEKCSLSQAYKLLKRTIRVLQSQKEGIGEYYLQYVEAAETGIFKGITLGHRGNFLNKEAFLQALIDNLTQKLEENVTLDGKDDLSNMLNELAVLDSHKWLDTLTSPWIEGEQRLRALCKRFALTYDDYVEGFRDFIDEPQHVPQSMVKLKAIVNTLPVSSADCERGFSTMNVICTDLRNSLAVSHISNLMLISLIGPPVSKFQPDSYVKLWLQTHRSADDPRTRMVSASHNQRYSKIWKLL